MALSATITRRLQAGESSIQQVFVDQVTCAADAAYATGGSTGVKKYLRDKMVAATGGSEGEWGARTVLGVEGWGVLASVLYLFKYDAVNDKLLAFLASTGAQVADTTDLSAMTMNLTLMST